MGAEHGKLWNDLFIAIDANGNNVLSHEEFSVAFANNWEGENNKKSIKDKYDELESVVFNSDTNDDGKVTKEEWKEVFESELKGKLSKELLIPVKNIIATAEAEKTAVWSLQPADNKCEEGFFISQGNNSLFECDNGKIAKIGPQRTVWKFYSFDEKDDTVIEGKRVEAEALAGKTVLIKANSGSANGNYLRAHPKVHLSVDEDKPGYWGKFTFTATKGGFKIRTDHNRLLNVTGCHKQQIGYHQVAASTDYKA